MAHIQGNRMRDRFFVELERGCKRGLCRNLTASNCTSGWRKDFNGSSPNVAHAPQMGVASRRRILFSDSYERCSVGDFSLAGFTFSGPSGLESPPTRQCPGGEVRE